MFALLAVGLVLLTGCGASTEDVGTPDNPSTSFYEDKEEIKVVHVDVDGRQVPCVIWYSYDEGGISCDFAAR